MLYLYIYTRLRSDHYWYVYIWLRSVQPPLSNLERFKSVCPALWIRIEQLHKSNYTGSVIIKNEIWETKIRMCIWTAIDTFQKLNKVWNDRKIPLETLERVRNCYRITIFLHAGEFWTASSLGSLQPSEMRFNCECTRKNAGQEEEILRKNKRIGYLYYNQKERIVILGRHNEDRRIEEFDTH